MLTADPARRPPVSTWVAYVVLACLFILVTAQQARNFVDLAKDLQLRYASSWIFLGDPWPGIIWAGEPAKAAGLQQGDRVLALNGHTPKGLKDLHRLEQQLDLGGTLRVTVERRGEVRTVSVVLRSTRTYMRPMLWVFAAVVWVAMPLLCSAVGFGVTAIRPRDPLAWLLLGLLLGLSQSVSAGNINQEGWEDWIRVPAIVFRILAQRTWPVWMLLFGLCFPQPLAAEQRRWWAKWILLGPYLLLVVAITARQVCLVELYTAAAGWGDWVRKLEPAARWISFLPISLFFTVLFTKVHSSGTDADSRRRLSLLIYGSTVSLTPIFVLLCISLTRGGDVPDGLPLLIALMMMFLFPVTVAYLIMVHRALDVRVVVRQGVQYALASGSVRLVQTGLTIVVAVLAVRLLENPRANTPQRISIIGGSTAAVVFMRRHAGLLRAWLDRRFFREAYRAEQILGELADEVHRVVETRPLLEKVTRRIGDSLHVTRVTALLLEGERFEPACTFGHNEAPDVTFAADGPIAQRLAENREPVHVLLGDAAFVAQINGELPQLRQLDASLLLPLTARDRLLGFISLGPKQSEEPYSGADVKLLQSVAAQTGLALENSRLAEQISSEVARRERLSRELEIAREVQLRLLPQKEPPVAGLDYAGACRPAFEIGGDYYDFLALPDGQFGVAIGDVSGKGVPAALLMASLQAGLRGQTVDGVSDLSRLMSNLNRFLYDSTPRNHFATFFYAQYDPATRAFSYSNAGHNPPLLLREEHAVALASCGPGLGLLRGSRYRAERVTLQPNDCLVLFTDGLTEAMNPGREEWEEAGVVAAAQACTGLTATLTVERVLAAATRFANSAPQHDDMTLVILRVTG